MVQKETLLKFRSSFQDKEWICLNCPVWVWEESWFNQFPQFEHLIKRETEN